MGTESQGLTALPVEQFLETLSSGSSAPGGGSASALAGAVGAALTGMVTRLTIGKPRYAAVQEDMLAWRDKADELRRRLEPLVTADAEAYARVTEAYRLPRDGETAQARRTESVQAALRGAVEVPLQVALACADVLDLLVQVARHGNKNAATDAAVAALLTHAALRGAILNILVNLDHLHDETYVAEVDALVAQLMTVGQAALSDTLAAVDPGE